MYCKSIAWKLAALLLAVTTLAGCSTPTAAPTTAPTMNVGLIQTQSAQTVVANLTLNAPTVTPTVPTSTATEVPPTETPAATNTPVPPTAVPTNTFIPWTLTPVYTATPAYPCTLVEVAPKFGDTLKVGSDFDGRWVVKNTGSKTWHSSDADIRFTAGKKFGASATVFDLAKDVAPDGKYTFIVDMKTPADPGTYTSTWVMAEGSQTLCVLNLNIKVVK